MGAISSLECWHRQLRQDGKVWFPCTGSTHEGISVMRRVMKLRTRRTSWVSSVHIQVLTEGRGKVKKQGQVTDQHGMEDEQKIK